MVHRSMFFALLLICIAYAGFSQEVRAQAPKTINYQGVLTDQSGNPVADDSYSIIFLIYDQESGGTAVWGESQLVQVRKGIFNAVLGTVKEIDVPFDKSFWITMKIDGGTELSPRTPLTGVAYSLSSVSTQSIDGLAAGGALEGTYPDPDLADGAVTMEKLSAGDGPAGKILGSDGTMLVWTSASGFDLPFAGSTSTTETALSVRNWGLGYAISGKTTSNTTAVQGANRDPDTTYTYRAGVRGDGSRNGVLGIAPGSSGTNNVGVRGIGDIGLLGQTHDASVTPPGKAGVVGVSDAGYGVAGRSLENDGVFGEASAQNQHGLRGEALGQNGHGVYARAKGPSGFGLYAKSDSSIAGYFSGRVNITEDCFVGGQLSASSKSFRIDHPLDPTNKYLQHVSVESPDMMTVYNGNVICGADGSAEVTLPAYFEKLNMDYRYQLTCVGGYAPVYVSEEIRGNAFRIAGGTPRLKVSWQVTGIRKDPYAMKHRVEVEIDKPPSETGRYLHPSAYDKPGKRGLYHRIEAAADASEERASDARID